MYEIRVLSDEEFESLPASETRGSDISDSLGFANKFNGRAYVRQTGIHDLNKYLISHELEELESDESTHEDENGIRHKKGPKFFKQILMPALQTILPIAAGFIPGIGPALSAGLSFAGPLLGGLGGGKQPGQGPSTIEQPQMQQMPSFGGFSQPQGPLSQFQAPSMAGTSQQAGGLNQGLGGTQSLLKNPLEGMDVESPEFKEKSKGFYSGRLAF